MQQLKNIIQYNGLIRLSVMSKLAFYCMFLSGEFVLVALYAVVLNILQPTVRLLLAYVCIQYGSLPCGVVGYIGCNPMTV